MNHLYSNFKWKTVFSQSNMLIIFVTFCLSDYSFAARPLLFRLASIADTVYTNPTQVQERWNELVRKSFREFVSVNASAINAIDSQLKVAADKFESELKENLEKVLNRNMTVSELCHKIANSIKEPNAEYLDFNSIDYRNLLGEKKSHLTVIYSHTAERLRYLMIGKIANMFRDRLSNQKAKDYLGIIFVNHFSDPKYAKSKAIFVWQTMNPHDQLKEIQNGSITAADYMWLDALSKFSKSLDFVNDSLGDVADRRLGNLVFTRLMSKRNFDKQSVDNPLRDLVNSIYDIETTTGQLKLIHKEGMKD